MAAGEFVSDGEVHDYPHPAAHLLAQAVADLGYLGSHGALAGVAAVIAERRRQVDAKVEHENTAYAAEGALDFGEYARAGALCAAVIDLAA